MKNQYPLDFDALTKGDILTQAHLQDILGVDPGLPRFRLACCGLAEQIEAVRHFTVKVTEHYNAVRIPELELHILTDSEASKHNPKLFERHQRGMYHRLDLNSNVDISNLSEDERRQHRLNLQNEALYVASLIRTRKEILDDSKKGAIPPPKKRKHTNA